MNVRTLLIATAVGLAAQLAMVIAGHWSPFVKDNVFALGGMAISLVAGLLFAKLAKAGWGPSLLGGLIAGGVCAVLGIAVSVGLGDTLPLILAIGTTGSAVAGLVGGGAGKLLA
jgi:hypothetical protein